MALSGRFKKSVVAGLIVLLPLLVTGLALIWIARLIEGTMGPLFEWAFGRSIPGLGFVSALLLVTAVGLVASTVLGSRLLAQGESLVTRIPLFKDIYVPVRQLVMSFSPDNESGFKRVVLVPFAGISGLTLGFLTREFKVQRPNGDWEDWAAVYVPTNHLHLGTVLCYPRSDLRFSDLTVEDAVRITLTGGTTFPDSVRERSTEDELEPAAAPLRE